MVYKRRHPSGPDGEPAADTAVGGGSEPEGEPSKKRIAGGRAPSERKPDGGSTKKPLADGYVPL